MTDQPRDLTTGEGELDPTKIVPAARDIGQELLQIESAIEQFRIAFSSLASVGKPDSELHGASRLWMDSPLAEKLFHARDVLRGELLGLNVVLNHLAEHAKQKDDHV